MVTWWTDAVQIQTLLRDTHPSALLQVGEGPLKFMVEGVGCLHTQAGGLALLTWRHPLENLFLHVCSVDNPSI